MRKRTTLVSILAIPIITLASGCRMPDSLNFPYQKPIKISIIENEKEKTISSYYKRFAESHTGSQVIEIKGKGIESKKYTGTGLIDSQGVDCFNGKPIHFYSPEEQEQINKDYSHYLKLVQSDQQAKEEIETIKIRKGFKEEATRRVKQELHNN